MPRPHPAAVARRLAATLAATSVVALAAPAASAGAQSPFAAAGEPVVVGRGYDVPSRVLGETRRVNVLLPDGYDDPKRADARYPVLYLLDGGAGWQDFVHIAGMVHQGGLWGANAPLIVVGVESRDRRAELTQPSSDAGERRDYPTHGRAEAFRRFLVEELRPQVEAAFRTDGTRGVMGESLAGLFVVDVALRHGGDFQRYIAVSPSLWWDGGRLAREAAALLAAAPTPAPLTRRVLWLSMADEGGAMQAGMDRLAAALAAHPRPDLAWSYTPYPAERHNTVYHPAATRAVRALFPAPAAPKP